MIAIVQHLVQRGLRVGVISRGYGRSSKSAMAVHQHSRPADVGDEPLLVQRRTGVPVWVADARTEAARALLAQHPQTQILVADDGLQHYALARDLEICVFDNRGIGNERLLPAGPLREVWPRRLVAASGQSAAASMVLHTGTLPAFGGHRAMRKLGPTAVDAEGRTIELEALRKGSVLPPATKLPLLALAGIAQPQTFFDMLIEAGLSLSRTLPLPDHFDFDSVSRLPLAGYQLICTEKDAVKLWRTHPQALAVPLIQALDASFVDALDNHVDRYFAKHPSPGPLSSPHGHTTT